MKIDRQHQPERASTERVKDFLEITAPFSEETAKLEAKRCLQCKNAPCRAGCPVGIDIPLFIAKILEGNHDEANSVIRATNNLPSVCGRVCPQEEQCEKNCVRKRMEGAVAIGALERYVGDKFLDKSTAAKKPSLTRFKVAVVGSGPAGLACAGDLAGAGVEVTIFEAFHKAGGVLMYGIPEFRLPKSLVEKEIQKVLDLGVKLELNTIVGKSISVEDILSEFDAVFIGSGAGLPQFLGLKGEGLNGILSANEYLTRINLMNAYKSDSDTPVIRGEKVFVFGAGNVAMDAARTAVRMGSKEVHIIYRRTMHEMPARNEEIRHAEEEGVIFDLLTAPIEFVGEGGALKGVSCVKCELGALDERGRRNPIVIEGSEHVKECDVAIIAVGTSPNPLITDSFADLKTGKKGTIIIDEDTCATSVDRVYAGGDAATGAATVILAMGAGKKAAQNIIDRLKAKN